MKISIRLIVDRTKTAYLRWPPKAKAYGADECTLACAVRADDHIQIRPWKELCRCVCDKVRQFDPNDGTRLMSRSILRWASAETGSHLGPIFGQSSAGESRSSIGGRALVIIVVFCGMGIHANALAIVGRG